MKNTCDRTILLLLALCLIFSQLPARAANTDMPPRPAKFVSDLAHVFKDSVSFVEQEAMEDYRQNHHRIYVASMPRTSQGSVSDTAVEAYMASICAAWHICGNDSCILMLIVPGAVPQLHVKLGDKIAASFPDATRPYLEYDYTDDVKYDGYVKATNHSVLLASLQISIESIPTMKDYYPFRKRYNDSIATLSQSTVQAADTTDSPSIFASLAIGVFSFFSLGLFVFYLILWSGYKEATT